MAVITKGAATSIIKTRKTSTGRTVRSSRVAVVVVVEAKVETRVDGLTQIIPTISKSTTSAASRTGKISVRRSQDSPSGIATLKLSPEALLPTLAEVREEELTSSSDLLMKSQRPTPKVTFSAAPTVS